MQHPQLLVGIMLKAPVSTMDCGRNGPEFRPIIPGIGPDEREIKAFYKISS